MGDDSEELGLDSGGARPLLEVATEDAVAHEDEAWRLPDLGERLDEPGEILLRRQAPHVEHGAGAVGGPGRRGRGEALRVHAVGKVGETRPGGVPGEQGLHLVGGDNDAGGAGKRHALEPAVEARLEPRAGETRDLAVVIPVGDDEGDAVERPRHQGRDHPRKLLDAERLALAELAAVEEGQEKGVGAGGPGAAAGKEPHLVEEQRIAGEVAQRLLEVAEVVDAVVGLAVVAEIVVEQPLVLARAPEVGEPAPEGGQDADRPERGRTAHDRVLP
jgi:hypothetical protein